MNDGKLNSFETARIGTRIALKAGMTNTTIDTTRELPACCYACDAAAVGIRDRRPEGGIVEAACARHAQHGLRTRAVCMYCCAPVVRGSWVVDGDHAHKGCHQEACS